MKMLRRGDAREPIDPPAASQEESKDGHCPGSDVRNGENQPSNSLAVAVRASRQRCRLAEGNGVEQIDATEAVGNLCAV
jgi:hypothetical protein